MNRYQSMTPRLAFAVVALALSASTMAVMVGAPASHESAVEVSISPSRIDVVATRSQPVHLSQLALPHVD
jgi:hypothetical protein